ncbi:MAG: 2'-5' RNA ligase family protein, partial [Micromonosporaceae bacterium]
MSTPHGHARAGTAGGGGAAGGGAVTGAPAGGGGAVGGRLAGTQRLFVAVDPPRAAIEHLAAVVGGLHVARAGARVAASERWHITVAFLGDVAGGRVGAVADAVAE